MQHSHADRQAVWKANWLSVYPEVMLHVEGVS